MNKWCKFLPLYFIEWYCKSRCEIQMDSHGSIYVIPFKGVRLYID